MLASASGTNTKRTHESELTAGKILTASNIFEEPHYKLYWVEGLPSSENMVGNSTCLFALLVAGKVMNLIQKLGSS